MRPGADSARRAALNAAKLGALVTSRWGIADRQPRPFAGGAALVGPSDDGGDRAAGDRADTSGGRASAAWVLIDGPAERSLGPAMHWGHRAGAERLHLVVDDDAGSLARRARLFAQPTPRVWRIEGTSITEAIPEPIGDQGEPGTDPDLVDLLIDAGLEIVVEGGIVRGEINGLEVARIVHDKTTAGVLVDQPLLEVGVGRADRELTAMVHGEMNPVDQLARVAEIVRAQRRPGAAPHPLKELVPERWLRAALCREPGRIGLAALRPAEAVRARRNLRDRDIAVAAGQAPGGQPAVVACSVGVDLDLVPAAADARETIDPNAGLYLAVPERDDHPGTRWLAGRLARPATVVPVRGDWRT